MNSPLLTDLYQLTMGQAYWLQNRHETEAVFHLFFRRAPFGETAAIFAGLEPALDYLTNLRFSEEDLTYLATIPGNDGKPLFQPGYLATLRDLNWNLTVKAQPEGSIAYPNTPLLQVRGSILQCQLVETALLNLINFQTLIATQAARICEAAQGDTVVEFGLRRAQGPDGGLGASRASYIGGCAATSNVLAGQRFNIPVKGTHAHSWVMSYADELDAFRAYAEAMPNNTTLLVDTYDTLEGVNKAIIIGLELQEKGHSFAGIRLDSGDLTALSIGARKLLDEAGFPDTSIVASNDLDCESIRRLKAAGAKIDTWGIGTKLVTAYDQPALGGVYKLGAIREEEQWRYTIKLSDDAIKVSNPGCLNAYLNEDQMVLYNEFEETPQQKALLETVLQTGQRTEPAQAITEIQTRATAAWRTHRESPLTITLSPTLTKGRDQLIAQNRK